MEIVIREWIVGFMAGGCVGSAGILIVLTGMAAILNKTAESRAKKASELFQKMLAEKAEKKGKSAVIGSKTNGGPRA